MNFVVKFSGGDLVWGSGRCANLFWFRKVSRFSINNLIFWDGSINVIFRAHGLKRQSKKNQRKKEDNTHNDASTADIHHRAGELYIPPLIDDKIKWVTEITRLKFQRVSIYMYGIVM